jgi:hypothetical protein
MLDVDDLVRKALLPPPTGFPGLVRTRKAQYLEDIRSGRRRRRRLRVLVLKSTVLPLVLVGAIVAALLPQLVNPPPAAATVLRTASASVSAQPPVTLAPGQYLYTEYRSLNEVVAVPRGASLTAESAATASFQQTLQVWTDRHGTGKYALSRGALQFSSPVNEGAWQASPLAKGWEDSHFRAQEIGTSIQDVTTNVASLPTDPKMLAAQIAAGKTGTAVDHIPAGPDTTFERAASLLVSPSVGMTPALLAALYDVLASQPGVTATPGVTAHSGAKGTAVSVDNASPGTVDRLIIDPYSGTPLEADAAPVTTAKSIPTPSGSATACSATACSSIQPSTGTVVLVVLWTGPSPGVVVNSEGSTTPAGS